jgi:hypothetical protein
VLNVAVGSTAARSPSDGDRRHGRLLVLLVFGIVWGLTTHGTFAGSGDEPHYLMIAHSLAFDRDLDLTNDYREATLIGGGTLQPEVHAIPRSGRLRPVHDIGMPLVFAPVVRLAYPLAETLGDRLPPSLLQAARLNKALLLREQLSLIMALLTGVLARELFLVFRRIGGTPRQAFAWALLVAVTPPIVSHAFLFFTEIPSALVTLVVFRRLAIEPMRSAGTAVLAGASTGFLLLIHARNVGIVAGLISVALLLWLGRELPTKLFAVFLLTTVLGVLARTVTTYALWGSLVTTPLAHFGGRGAPGTIAREMFVRGTGLLFDREFGLLAYAPIYLLAAPGVFLLWSHRRRLARDLLIVAACYVALLLLPLTNVAGWTGGWSPAARFLVPIAPLLSLGVYSYALHVTSGGRAILGALATLQIAIDAYVWQFPKTLWNDGDGMSAFRWSEWLPSWLSPEPGATLRFAAALGAAIAFGYLCFKCSRAPLPQTADNQVS